MSQNFHFINHRDCNINNCLSTKNILKFFFLFLEKLHIGPSGLISKLRRIEMAVEWLKLEAEAHLDLQGLAFPEAHIDVWPLRCYTFKFQSLGHFHGLSSGNFYFFEVCWL